MALSAQWSLKLKVHLGQTVTHGGEQSGKKEGGDVGMLELTPCLSPFLSQKLALHALKVCRLAYNTLSHSRQPTVQPNNVYLPPLWTDAH